MPRETRNCGSNDLDGLNGVQVTSTIPKGTPRSQQEFENFLIKSSVIQQTSGQTRSRDLVLQMYTHIKTHRKLEQERAIRLSKLQRSRPAKQESFSSILSPCRFTSKCYNHRHSNPNLNLDTDSDPDPKPHTNPEINYSRTESVGSATEEIIPSNLSNVETLVPVDLTTTMESELTLLTSGVDSETTLSPTDNEDLFPDTKSDNGDKIRRQQSCHRSDANNSGKDVERTEKSKLQFHSSTPEEPEVEQRRVKIHWNNVKPGAVVPAPMAVVTFDGSLFT